MTDGQEASDKPPAAEADAATTGRWDPPHGGHHFSLAVAVGYGLETTDIYGLQLDPYGLRLSGWGAYTFDSGVSVGVYGGAFQGGTVSQVYEPAFTNLQIAMDAQTTLGFGGAQIGYDQPLGPVQLQYSFGVGASFMDWDFGELPYLAIAGFSPMTGSLVGLHLRPGLAVKVPLGLFFFGTGVHYRLETSTQIPDAFSFEGFLGVRL